MLGKEGLHICPKPQAGGGKGEMEGTECWKEKHSFIGQKQRKKERKKGRKTGIQEKCSNLILHRRSGGAAEGRRNSDRQKMKESFKEIFVNEGWMLPPYEAIHHSF